jgi:hypothetical protein
MTDRPILFSGAMVRALLAGRKTQTRRVGRMRPGVMMDDLEWDGPPGTIRTGRARMEHIAVPFAVGDRLYVREAWRTWGIFDDLAPSKLTGNEGLSYVADESAGPHPGKFRQGMHMPRWASRLTLAVTDVRVQRLQDISEADAEAEGIQRIALCGVPGGSWKSYDPNHASHVGWVLAVQSYQSLWDSLNEVRGYGWDTNPWVLAVTFSVEHRNIDA